jgi:hypothetical protein
MIYLQILIPINPCIIILAFHDSVSLTILLQLYVKHKNKDLGEGVMGSEMGFLGLGMRVGVGGGGGGEGEG